MQYMRFEWLVFWCSTVGASAESKLDAVREEVLDDRASINQPASNPGADDKRHSSDLQHPDPLSDVT